MTDEQATAAAVDIGSNSIKMTIGRAGPDGSIEQLGWESEVVRLGQGLDETGRLDEARIEHAIETLQRFAARARDLGAGKIVAVATEATRSASNGAAFTERVARETGIEVRTVDGLEEAALVFRGLAADVDVSGHLVVADIGGASTEIIVANDGVMLGARSIPLGSGRITDRLGLSDPPTLDELAASEQEAAAAIERTAKSLKLPRGEGARLIIVGGTGEFMTRLVPDEARIDLKTVKDVLGKLAVLNAAELADAIDIPEARARVLPAGVAIVSAIANKVHPIRVEVARSGLRAGVLAELFERERADGRQQMESMVTAGRRPASEAGRGRSGVAADGATVEPDFQKTMKSLIRVRWEAVRMAIPAALEGTDIEGVHDVRVASRRLGAAMDIGAPVFPKSWYRPLHRSAKEITSALGEVRDRDVLLEALRTERETAPLAEIRGIDRLIARVEGERKVARAEMERFLADLLASDLWNEVARRFGNGQPPGSPGNGARRR